MDQTAQAAELQSETGPFRFYDNREKYLLFVTTCSEKSAIAERIGAELVDIQPRRPALHLFDAGMGDGSVLSQVMQDMHKRFRHIPWVVVGKEISMEDVRLTLAKLPDRFFEHPETVVVTQPDRARQPATIKVRNVIAPLARDLAPGGKLVIIQSFGEDPGMEIINRIWPDEQPFRTRRHQLLEIAAAQLDAPADRDLIFIPYDDAQSLFRYHLHTLPTEIDRSIGLS